MLYRGNQGLLSSEDVARHSRSVGSLVDIITSEMDLTDVERRIFICSAKYHDIGKDFIDRNILYKPDKLSPEEKKEVQRHARLGADYMRKNPYLKYYADHVMFHHENFDASGYFGVKGTKIPLASRIIRIADYFDALCDNRPYRSAYTITEALGIIEKDIAVFDPFLFDLFMSLFSKNENAERRIRELYEKPEAVTAK